MPCVNAFRSRSAAKDFECALFRTSSRSEKVQLTLNLELLVRSRYRWAIQCRGCGLAGSVQPLPQLAAGLFLNACRRQAYITESARPIICGGIRAEALLSMYCSLTCQLRESYELCKASKYKSLASVRAQALLTCSKWPAQLQMAYRGLRLGPCIAAAYSRSCPSERVGSVLGMGQN